MYCVIQFDETGDESVAVVSQNWLTPLKKEVYWPPLKDRRIFRRALENDQAVDCEKWKLYGVKKIFFQTDDLDKAIRKEKEAQVNSDINDTDDNETTLSGPRKRLRTIIEDSDSEEETKYSRPPHIKIKKLSGAIEKKQIPPRVFSGISAPSEIPSTSALNATPPIEVVSLPTVPSSPTVSISYDKTATDSIRVLVNLLNTVKEQNKVILEKVSNIENIVFNKGTQVLETCNSNKNPLLVDLPLGNEHDLKEVEQFLKEETNFKKLVNYLATIGGNNVKSKIHKILRHLLTNHLASQFSYFGRRGKAQFSELFINKAIIETLQSKIEGCASITEIEDTIKAWLKHSPDRMKTIKTVTI